MEKPETVSALAECGWVMAGASRRVGITERMIGYKVRKYDISKEVTLKGVGRAAGAGIEIDE